jgi:RNA polymerase sigma-70 factor (ECF subfamily)
VSEEQTWIDQSLAGNRAAFGRLVEAYQRPVYSLAYRMLGNRLEAEDAAQESFVRAYTKLHTYRPERKFSTWLLSITSHHCIDRLRRRRFTWLSLEEPLPPQRLRSEHGLPEDSALRAEKRDEVRQLLKALEPAYRTPIVLRYWHDMSYQEIAETLGISLGAVKSRLHRARLKMAQVVAESETARPVLAETADAVSGPRAPSAEAWAKVSA